MSKTNFFVIFQEFSDRTFASNRIQSAFRKTSLILYNLSIVLDKMKDFEGIQEIKSEKSSKEEEPAFATPLLLP